MIIGNVRPDGSCTYSTSARVPCGQPDSDFYCDGYLDVAFGRPYVAHLLVENTGEDSVRVDDGWRNVWYEPSHAEMIRGTGEAARRNLVYQGVTIPGGGRRIVEVDPLGDGFTVYKRQFESSIQHGGLPADQQASIVVVLEGDADGTEIESEQWEFGLTVGIGRLVDFDPTADSPDLPGQDCCARAGRTTCEGGQNWNPGSCVECASCWPELCNFGLSPYSCSPPLPGCSE